MKDKNTLVGAGFFHFDGGMRDSFKIDGRLWDENRKSNVMDTMQGTEL